ncbi:hypothetical protein PENTCL1PPCAC_24829, partial [Pristionchus entomophagus]
SPLLLLPQSVASSSFPYLLTTFMPPSHLSRSILVSGRKLVFSPPLLSSHLIPCQSSSSLRVLQSI